MNKQTNPDRSEQSVAPGNQPLQISEAELQDVTGGWLDYEKIFQGYQQSVEAFRRGEGLTPGSQTFRGSAGSQTVFA